MRNPEMFNRVPDISRSGRLHEESLFGSADLGENRPDSEELKRLIDRYLPYGQALELAKKLQKNEPTAPTKPFLRDLREAVADELGLATTEDLENLKAYTAVGTPLDKLHGVDAFISVRDADGFEATATLDATLREEKLQGELPSRSDILIGEIIDPTDGPTEEAAYLKQVAGYAKTVARILRSRLNRPRPTQATPRPGGT